MKKKILALLTVITLCAAMLPTSALADTNGPGTETAAEYFATEGLDSVDGEGEELTVSESEAAEAEKNELSETGIPEGNADVEALPEDDDAIQPDHAEEPDALEDSAEIQAFSETGTADRTTYTAYDSGVAVSVTIPSDALPADAELTVTLLDHYVDHEEDSGEDTEEDSEEDTEEDSKIDSEQTGESAQEAEHFTFSAGEEDESESGTIVLDISFYADGGAVEPTEPAEVVIDASGLLAGSGNVIESIEVWHIEKTAEGTNPVLVDEVSDSDIAAEGVAAFSVNSFSEFEFHYTSSQSNGWAGFGANLIDENGNIISATVSGDYTINNGRYAKTVTTPYEFSIEDFTEVFTTTGTYTFQYATVTDPNFGDEEHTFDIWPDEEQVGANELYGSEENQVVSVEISETAASENPNYGTGVTISSRTWHFTLTYEDGASVTIPIYGNADGANDNGGKYCPKYLEINLYYKEDEEAVLNLGNGNGTYSDGDYTGSNASGGEALRYGTGALGNYVVNGKVTINLPSDDDLDTNFTVVDAIGTVGEEGYQPEVTIELGNAEAYDYKLIGWINIATGDYYDVSNGSTTATIDLADDNVFYADWIGANYDRGSSSDDGLREDTVSTSSFVTLQMFDFNELFNLYSVSLEQNGTSGETWTDSGSFYSKPLLGNDADTMDDPIADSFIFHNNGITRTNVHVLSHANPQIWNLWTANEAWSGQPEYNFVLDANKYWNITSPDSTILGMLYDTSESSLGVHYVGNADYLFWVDEDGYYTYDSAVSGAAYNQSDERFYVYKDNANAFFPYNDHTEARTSTNGFTDYWFGMYMEVNIYIPTATSAGSEQSPVNQVNGKDMVFDFSGDDDIMIFIDGRMVADMSGIHGKSYSRVNFSTNTVTYSMGLDENGAPDTTGAGGKYSIDENLNLSAGGHTMQIFYMERGASASNLKVQFNLVPTWEYETGPVQTVTANKVWEDSEGNEITDTTKLPSVEVGLFDALGPATGDTFGYTVDGSQYTVTYTDDEGITRTYIYDTDGPTLTYKEGDVSGTDTETNSKGQVIDKDGYVVAWLEGETLHIRIDKQTLSNENNWTYAWELLDADGSYEALELSEDSSYTTSSTSADLEYYPYWSVIGDAELEEMLGGGSDAGGPIILTEAAQEAENTLGDTKEATGYVIVATKDGVSTKPVDFSQIATMSSSSVDGQTMIWHGIYGVTSQSEIEKLGSGALWYPVNSGNTHRDSSDNDIRGFYLYCQLDSKNYYLALNSAGDGLTVTTDRDRASEFFYDLLGEFMVSTVTDGVENAVRVEIDPGGNIQIDAAEWEAALDDVRIYTLSATLTGGFAAVITNTVTPTLTIRKEVVGDSAVSEYAFRITLQENGSPYNGEITAVYSDGREEELTFTDGVAVVTIGADESVTLSLQDGMVWEVTEITDDADYVLIYVDGTVVKKPSDPDKPYAASGTIAGSSQVRFINSYRGYFPIDEEIVPDDTDRTTWVKDEAVNEYNAIEIEMSTILPVITAYDLTNGSYTMNFHEVLDHELLLDEADADFTVFIAGYQVDHQYYTVSIGDATGDGCSFHVDVDLTALYSDGVITEEDLRGDTEIIIFFFADLEGTGLNGTYKSTVWYEIYDSDELLYTSNVDEVWVYTYEIDILKYDSSTLNGTDYAGSALAGATLGVYYDADCTDPVSRNGEAYTVTSGSDGKAVFYGLADGTYYVKETAAPEGYELSTKVLTIVLGEALNDSGYAFEVAFANTPSSSDEPDPDPTDKTMNIKATKVWEGDSGDERPASVEISLLVSDEVSDTVTLDADNGWTHTWTDLPVYDGRETAIQYRVKEASVPEGYAVSYGDWQEDDGTYSITVTNTLNEETVTGPGPAAGSPDGSEPVPTGGGKTGDMDMTYLWILLMIAAAAFIVAGVAFRTRPRVRR